MSLFRGSCTALVTPMTRDGKNINYDSFKKLIDFQIESGIKALVFVGTTGESATLSEQEKLEIATFAVSYVAGRVPVIMGSGSNNTETAIRLSRDYEAVGVDALLVVTPYYNKCSQNGLFLHYSAIANSVKIPVILYNVPSRTGVNLRPHTIYKLSKIDNIIAVKEASGDLQQISEIYRLCGDKCDIYSGDDALILPILAVGGQGIISVASNIVPAEIDTLCEHFFSGRIEEARNTQMNLLPLVSTLFSDVNPIPIKTALEYLGFDVGALRLPLCNMDESLQAKMFNEIDNFKKV